MPSEGSDKLPVRAGSCYLTWPDRGRRHGRIGTLPLDSPVRRIFFRKTVGSFARSDKVRGFRVGEPANSPVSGRPRKGHGFPEPQRDFGTIYDIRDGPETREGESLLVPATASVSP